MFKYVLLTSVLWLFRQLVPCFVTFTVEFAAVAAAVAAAAFAVLFALGMQLFRLLQRNINSLVFCASKNLALHVCHIMREKCVLNAIAPNKFTSDLITLFFGVLMFANVCVCNVPLVILSLLIIRDTFAAMLLFLFCIRQHR